MSATQFNSSNLKSSSASELDLTNASRGVWLVKVPKYISSRWENAKEQTEVGKLLISKGADGTPEIKFNLSEELIKVPVDKVPAGSDNAQQTGTGGKKNANSVKKQQTTVTNEKFIPLDPKPIQPKNSLIGTKKDIVLTNKIAEIPREHKFAISDISHQHLAVFSESLDDKQNKRLILEGNVVQKGECRPIADSLYMDLKKQRIVEARQPTRLVKQLDRAVVNYKPLVSNRVEAETRRKNDQKKSREDKDKVMDMLFNAFEKHEYYLLKDLLQITQTPVAYLKEILKEIAVFNQKAPYKNMWRLRPGKRLSFYLFCIKKKLIKEILFSEFSHYKPNNASNSDQGAAN